MFYFLLIKYQEYNIYKILRIHRLKRFAILEKYQCMLEEILIQNIKIRGIHFSKLFLIIGLFWSTTLNIAGISIADIIEVNFKFK